MSDRHNSLIYPHEAMKSEWFQKTRSLCGRKITASYCIEPPDTIKMPSLSHHIVFK